MTLALMLLVGSGAMCPKCGYGTRATSKRWAKCKKCGHRVERKPMEQIAQQFSNRALGGGVRSPKEGA